MSCYVLENEKIKVTIDSKGAEIKSVIGKSAGTEYMWHGDKLYWGRTAPILFPLVGNVKNKQYSYQGNIYSMNQHGFARDKEFTLKSQSENEIWFTLTQDTESLKIYPFDFMLSLGYVINGNEIKVLWKVLNTGDQKLYFSIGAHPAFICPIKEGEKQSDYCLAFDAEDDIMYRLVNEKGEIAYSNNLLPLSGEEVLEEERMVIEIPEHLFDQDALIIEGNQAHQVSLLTPDRKPYVTVSFDAPLFGVWSPAGKQAPFICIEPWYGRSDAADFCGTWEEREYGNALLAGESFDKAYTISFHQE